MSQGQMWTRVGLYGCAALLIAGCATPPVQAPEMSEARKTEFIREAERTLSREIPPSTSKPPEDKPPKDPGYVSCRDGSRTLQQIDALDRRGEQTTTVVWLGQVRTPEEIAELLIADCSIRLSLASGGAGLFSDPHTRAMWGGLVNAWQRNLEFMKWWLQNRREKAMRR